MRCHTRSVNVFGLSWKSAGMTRRRHNRSGDDSTMTYYFEKKNAIVSKFERESVNDEALYYQTYAQFPPCPGGLALILSCIMEQERNATAQPRSFNASVVDPRWSCAVLRVEKFGITHHDLGTEKQALYKLGQLYNMKFY